MQITAAVVDLTEDSDLDDRMVQDEEEVDSYEVDESDGPIGERTLCLFSLFFVLVRLEILTNNPQDSVYVGYYLFSLPPAPLLPPPPPHLFYTSSFVTFSKNQETA